MSRRVTRLRALPTCALTLLVASMSACSPGGDRRGPADESDLPKVRVTRVIDGDTVVATRLGRIRLIGVDTPEEGRCLENEATRFTRERLEDQLVGYEFDKEREDRHGRTLAYLNRDGMHNLALVEEGYARPLIIPPNDRYASPFMEAYRKAKERRVGRWSGECQRRRRARAAAQARRAKAEARERRRARARTRRIAADRRRAVARQAARERAAARRARRRAGEASGGSGSRSSVPPPPPDLDCKDISGSVRVGSSDPHRLDADGDGVGCE